MARNLDLSAKEFTPYEPPTSELLYLNPTMVKVIRYYIANWLRDKVREQLENAWSNVFMQDGSNDITQKENYFHASRSLMRNGDFQNVFISLEEKKQYGAEGQKDCFQRSIKSLYYADQRIHSDDIWKLFQQKRESVLEIQEDDFKEIVGSIGYSIEAPDSIDNAVVDLGNSEDLGIEL